MTASTQRYLFTCAIFFLSVRLGNASRHIFPSPTFAGLRHADLQFNIRPTPNPWTPSNIAKRFADDPAICGWVEGKDNDAVSCQSGSTCAAISTFVGCCPKGNSKDSSCTALFTTCYDVRGKSCDAACSSNTAALICDHPDYCATYRYASGSQGFGCAKSTGYDKTVLTVTGSSVTQPTPFGHDPSTTSTASTSTAGEASSTSNTGLAASNSATAVTAKPKSVSGGAIAGIVIGSLVGVAAILLILLFLFQRYRKKQAQRQGNQTSQGPYEMQYQHIYDQYGKPVYSPPWSPQSHSRHQSELAGVPVSPDPSHKNPLASPNISEADGRPFSPETVQGSLPANDELSDGGQQNPPAELPAVDR